MPTISEALSGQIQIPALKLPDCTELEPMDLSDLADALRRDGLLFEGGLRGGDAMRGHATLGGPSTFTGDAPWRLVVPRQSGAAGSSQDLIGALAPLAERRSASEPLYYDVDESRSHSEGIGRFYDTYATEIAETTYFLIAGTGAEIPFALQQQLSIGKAVGRLGFPSIDGYSTYADKVVRAEKGALEHVSRPILSFGPGGDDATDFSRRVLVEPMAHMLKFTHPARGGPPLVGDLATRGALLEALSGDGEGAPSLFFCASHGAESRDPTSDDQGALSTHQRVLLRAADFSDRTATFLKDGVAVFFACNGGGTPRERWWPSVFRRPPATSPGEDRIAALPLALLSLINGPLAVVAHLDVLSDWGLRSYAGALPASVDGPGMVPLRDAVKAVARGLPAGFALRPLVRAAGELQQQLYRTLFAQSRMRGPLEARRNAELGMAWIRWHDAQGWILLGDPRVCLEGVNGALTLEDSLRGE